VWEPVFHPQSAAVVAPVRINGKWHLAQDGRILWDRKFVQLWHAMYSPDGNRLAAIVAPRFGKWTMAVDGKPWSVTFKDLVTDAVFNAQGTRLAAAAKEDHKWLIAVDGRVWGNTFDRVWQPVFSPAGDCVAVKMERKGKYGFAVNDRLWEGQCDAVWDPVFSAAGDKLLLRTVKDGRYIRHVMPVGEILS
jgi:hypothetical protein